MASLMKRSNDGSKRCADCTNRRTCGARGELVRWLKKHDLLLTQSTSRGSEIKYEFLELLAATCYYRSEPEGYADELNQHLEDTRTEMCKQAGEIRDMKRIIEQQNKEIQGDPHKGKKQ